MVKLYSLAQFPVDHLSHPVVLTLVLLLCQFHLSLHQLNLLFCIVLSIFDLILLVLITLFSVAINQDSVSFFRFLLISHVLVISGVISFVYYLKYQYSCFLLVFFFFAHFSFLDFIVLLFVLRFFTLILMLLAVLIILSLPFFD